MPRAKKKPEELLEQLEQELELEAEHASHAEQSEAKEASEEANADSEETAEEKPAPKKRKRRSRKKKAPAVELEASEIADEPEVADEPEGIEETEIPEPDEDQISAVAAAREMENHAAVAAGMMAKQWNQIKEITGGVIANLERVNLTLKEMTASQPAKVSIVKPAMITKVAMGLSAFSLLLSIISVTLSQMARDQAFEKPAFASTTAPKIAAPEVATRPAVPNAAPRHRSKR